jgi:histidinol-phosphatase (PHP family)
MICNYHTHTYRCKHALGDIDDYIEEALAHNVNCLGISDHTPLPDNRWLGVRMHIDEFKEYNDAINAAKLRYHDKIHILKGMECDWAPEYVDFYKNILQKKHKFDYLIGACHWFPFEGKWQMAFNITTPPQVMDYAEFLIEAIGCGLFSFIAHPDVFCSNYEWDNTAIKAANLIFEAAQEHNMPLEINGYGFRKQNPDSSSGIKIGYPCYDFWELAENYDIQVFCNSDAHLPSDIISGIDDCRALAEKFNLQQVAFE